MTNEEIRSDSCFVDGVEKLHRLLYENHLKAAKIANDLIGKKKPRTDRTSSFCIYVDFEETQPDNKIKGYFTSKNTILRFLPVEFDYALLFPVKNHGGGTFKQALGILFSDIQQAQRSHKKLFLKFTPIRAIEREDNKIFYNIKIVDESVSCCELDDIGLPYYSFPDITKLAIVDIPSDYIGRQYRLVGKQFYAPLTRRKEMDCVLFAQLDNEYDEYAIKVLRWFPAKKGDETDKLLGFASSGGDCFFELGHISKEENSALHKYMVDNNSRLLFGKILGDKVSITGGVKLFKTNDLKYPRCLYNIPLK